MNGLVLTNKYIINNNNFYYIAYIENIKVHINLTYFYPFYIFMIKNKNNKIIKNAYVNQPIPLSRVTKTNIL